MPWGNEIKRRLIGRPRNEYNRGKYTNKLFFVVAHGGYAYLVPFIEEADYYFLKTVIPSRKATRDYLQGGGKNEKET